MDQVSCEVKGRMVEFKCRLSLDQVKAVNTMYSKNICVEDFLSTAMSLDIEKILGLYASVR